ncbi:hypothetical protein JZU51_00045, partial [bacterium]|nr:hypothetical protein [bacterium]
MGLLQKTSIALEISHGGIAGALVVQRAKSATLLRATRIPLPDECLSNSLKELQVLQPEAFVRALREAWGSLHSSLRQVALSLPDSAGRTVLMQLDEPWKQRAEAVDLLRWKLGKRMGMSPDLLHLDFQVLERKQDGATQLLVALTHRSVIQQYEELALEAGLQPTQIGFHTLHLQQLFNRLPLQTGLIITLYDTVLGTCALADNKPVFYRV